MKSTPHLKPHIPDGTPQVSWLLAEGNYTHLHFHNGSQYLLAITLCKVCQRYPYLLRLNKQLAVDPTLIVGWQRLAAKQMIVVLERWGNRQTVVVSRRRIREVRQLLRQIKG
ncbi:LytTR family transcriptional regulator [Spirosoma sp. BT702]|uniref:LytTR family transcriptional regulator n=1 Tax=Spirosoma profusum TaxID=2771354 RepID=A0A927ATP0_9BACT|nr:LytTR family transcriptional regulator DNA-binding domain-containing protein [Spirosoma profusum]MBD2704025.1 LytTR family transcriptional regulator [Spirosoma profusum]